MDFAFGLLAVTSGQQQTIIRQVRHRRHLQRLSLRWHRIIPHTVLSRAVRFPQNVA